MGYEFFQGKIIFPSAPVPGINNDQSLKQEYDSLCLFLTKLNWIVAPTAYISRLGFGPQFGCVHVQVLLSIDQVSGLVDIRREEQRTKTRERQQIGKSTY